MTDARGVTRGEVWIVDLDPTRGHEQAGRRPALVISVDQFNRSPADLVIVLPLTSRARGVRSHVGVNPPEGGLILRSFIKCEDIRSVAKERLVERTGAVLPHTLASVERTLVFLLGLSSPG